MVAHDDLRPPSSARSPAMLADASAAKSRSKRDLRVTFRSGSTHIGSKTRSNRDLRVTFRTLAKPVRRR